LALERGLTNKKEKMTANSAFLQQQKKEWTGKDPLLSIILAIFV